MLACLGVVVDQCTQSQITDHAVSAQLSKVQHCNCAIAALSVDTAWFELERLNFVFFGEQAPQQAQRLEAQKCPLP